MCVSPIRIKNPNFGIKVPIVMQTKDTKSMYINIPCGVCPECLRARQNYLVQRVQTMLLDHYCFFCTLTYNNESLPCITTSSGIDIKYADISDVQNMIKRIRRNNLFGRPLDKYLFVSERGSAFGRPHFHGLIFIPKFSNDDCLVPAQLETTLKRVVFREWRRNYGTSFNPVWKPLFTYKTRFNHGRNNYNFDLHYVTPFVSKSGASDVAYYVTKYVLKPSDKEQKLQQALKLNLSEEEYNEVWKLVRSRCLCSKFFGASTDIEISFVKDCIESSRSNPTGFKYKSPSGSLFPLSRYYNKFISDSQKLDSVKATNGPVYNDLRDDLKKIQSIDSFQRTLTLINSRDKSNLIPF